MLFLLLCQASAQDEGSDSTSKWMSETRLRLLVSGEQWKDPNIGDIYKRSHMYPMVGGSYRFHRNLALGLDTGVYQIEGNLGATESRAFPLFIGGSFLGAKSELIEPFKCRCNICFLCRRYPSKGCHWNQVRNRSSNRTSYCDQIRKPYCLSRI